MHVRFGVGIGSCAVRLGKREENALGKEAQREQGGFYQLIDHWRPKRGAAINQTKSTRIPPRGVRGPDPRRLGIGVDK